MKKEDLKIEIGNLYEISEKRKCSDYFESVPRTMESYKNEDRYTMPKSWEISWFREMDNKLYNPKPNKISVMVKNIWWLNFSRKGMPKSAIDCAWLPVIEVYNFVQNETYFVKARVLIELRDGKDLNEVSEINLKNIKQRLLSSLTKE